MRHTVPLSILLGSVIIAIGLYLGLRDRRPAPDVVPASGAAPGSSPTPPDPGLGDSPARPEVPGQTRPAGDRRSPAEPPRVAGPAPDRADPTREAAPSQVAHTAAIAALPPSPPAVADALRERVTALASEALAAAKPRFEEACWNPLLAEAPEPATAAFVFDVTFDGATGRIVGRGVSEPRGESRADVAQCLRSLPLDLAIEPQGANVGVQVRLTFP